LSAINASNFSKESDPAVIRTHATASRTSATIYSDDIHYGYEANGDSLGYRLLVEAMSEKIARAWNLQKR